MGIDIGNEHNDVDGVFPKSTIAPWDKILSRQMDLFAVGFLSRSQHENHLTDSVPLVMGIPC